ncbi:hypothetical protein BC628DRAFT_299890 [Trametes gibbosa]|nr:hypothetical protein BC628DRAFT_299890 [Trametes gibbosa]
MDRAGTETGSPGDVEACRYRASVKTAECDDNEQCSTILCTSDVTMERHSSATPPLLLTESEPDVQPSGFGVCFVHAQEASRRRAPLCLRTRLPANPPRALSTAANGSPDFDQPAHLLFAPSAKPSTSSHAPRRPRRPARAMYIRSETPATLPSPESADAQLCPSSYPFCYPTLSAGPALVNADSSEGSPAPTTTYPTAPDTYMDGVQPEAQATLAGSIQHIGRRNFVGIVVIAVLVIVGLALWLSFGKWPRAGLRWFRARVRGCSGERSHAGGSSEAAVGHIGGEHAERDDDPSAGRTQAGVQDEKRCGEADARAGREPPCSPLEVEVDSLEKCAGETPVRRGLHVHFA